MSTSAADTEKNAADNDAKLSVSRSPELTLKDLPRVPEYSGTGAYETVDHPSHYGGDTTYEVIKVVEAWGLGFGLGNAVKYIARAGSKPEVSELEDLKKAAWYLQREISKLQ